MIKQIITALMITITPPVAGDEIVGTAWLKDGDSFVINKQEIRVLGLNTPEWGNPWGKTAKFYLLNRIKGKELTCTHDNQYGKYKRLLASCTVDGGNIAAWLIKSGMACATRKYDKTFVKEEMFARKHRLGIWGAYNTESEAMQQYAPRPYLCWPDKFKRGQKK